MEIKKLGVLGCGQMGSGIVQVFAQSGYEVVAVDTDEQMLERAGTDVLEKLDDNNWYYYFQRDDLRYGSVTNQPSNVHSVELNLNFRPDRRASLSAGLKASLGTNPDTDSLDFERTQLQPQLSASFAPTPMWNLFGSLAYMYDKSNGLAAVAMMDG